MNYSFLSKFKRHVNASVILITCTILALIAANIPGIKGSDMLTFTANYTSADFAAVNGEANKALYYELSFSDGSKFTWQGQHTCGLPGKGVDEVVDFTVNVVPSSAVEFKAATA